MCNSKARSFAVFLIGKDKQVFVSFTRLKKALYGEVKHTTNERRVIQNCGKVILNMGLDYLS